MTYRPDLPVLPPPVPSYKCSCGREFLKLEGALSHAQSNPDHEEAS